MNTQRRQKFIQGGVIIISSLIWAVVILSCSWVLKEHYEKVSTILILGATMHVILLSAVRIDRLKKIAR